MLRNEFQFVAPHLSNCIRRKVEDDGVMRYSTMVARSYCRGSSIRGGESTIVMVAFAREWFVICMLAMSFERSVVAPCVMLRGIVRRWQTLIA